MRESICAKLLKENNLAYTPDQIVVSAGGKQALFNAFFVLLNGGEEVLIPTPAWPTYKQQVLLCGGTPVLIPLDESSEFKLTKETLKAFITPRSKILVLNSPSNPTGATYSEEELDDLVSIVEENGLYVISDEIYERLVYSGTYSSPVGINDYMKKHSVLVNGFSKAFGMTGWRIGYTAAPLDISIKIAAFQSQTTASISSISQVAAKYAINNFDPAVTEPAPTPPIMLSMATMKSSTCDGAPHQPQATADSGEPDEQLKHLIQQIHDGLL